MLIHKGNEILLEDIPVGRLDSFTKDVESARHSTKVPAAERNNLLDPGHTFEEVKLLLNRAYIDVEVLCHIGESEVDMRIFIHVDLADIHGQALALMVPGFKVCYMDRPVGRPAVDNVSATVTDA